MQGCARVFHAAGRVSFQSGDEARLKAVNAAGTAHVVNAALACRGAAAGARVQRWPRWGSSHVGDGAIDLTVPRSCSDWADGVEASPLHTGVSKHAGRARGVARRWPRGWRCLWSTPPSFSAMRATRRAPGWCTAGRPKGRRYHPAGGNGFVGAGDLDCEVCAAHWMRGCRRGCRRASLGERFVVVRSEIVTYRDLMRWVADGLGVRAARSPACWKSGCSGLGWRLQPLLGAALSGKPRHPHAGFGAEYTRRHHRYDTSKLQQGAAGVLRLRPFEEVVQETSTSPGPVT